LKLKLKKAKFFLIKIKLNTKKLVIIKNFVS
jgi:hypothetical protein